MNRPLLVAGAVVAAIACWVVVAWPSTGSIMPDPQPLAGSPAPPPSVEAAPAPPAAPPPAPGAATPSEPAPEPALAPKLAAPARMEVPAPAPAIEPGSSGDILGQPFGPLDELKTRFEREPRDSAAAEYEPILKDAFVEDKDLNPALIKSVLCRETVCKLELRWSPDRMTQYIAGMTRASLRFDVNPGVEPREPLGEGFRQVDVYVQRRQPAPEAK